MLKFKKQIASIALSVALVFTAMPFATFASFADDADATATPAAESTTPTESIGSADKQSDKGGVAADTEKATAEAGKTESETKTDDKESADVEKKESDEEKAKKAFKIVGVEGGTLSTVKKNGCEYIDMNGDKATIDEYTLEVAPGKDNVVLNFGDRKYIAFTYSAADKSWKDNVGYSVGGCYSGGGFYPDWGNEGETSATITKDYNGNFAPYVFVQTPYAGTGNSTDVCVIHVKPAYSISNVEGGTLSTTCEATSYIDMGGNPATIDGYTLKVNKDAEQVILSFGDKKEFIAYTYSMPNKAFDGTRDYSIGSCAATKSYGSNGMQGETKAIITKDYKDGFAPYVFVQTPYDASWSSTDLCIIKLEVENDKSIEPDAQSEENRVASLEKTREKVNASMQNSYGYEWSAISLIRDGQNVDDAYFQAIAKEVASKKGSLETNEWDYTNNARAILAVTAGGYDATQVAGYNLIEKLADYDAIVKQGVNSVAFALIALDSHNYDIPVAKDGATQATRDKLIDYLLDSAITVEIDKWSSYCGWTYSGDTPDVDMTSMVMWALAPYKDRAEVAAKLNGAKNYLSIKFNNADIKKEKDENTGKEIETVTKEAGTFGNANAVGTAVVALASLGINPELFVRSDNGKTIIDDLNRYAINDGGFYYGDNTSMLNGYATKDGYQALIALDRLNVGKTAFFDMSDITELKPLGENKSEEPQPEEPKPEKTYTTSENFTLTTAEKAAEVGTVSYTDYTGTHKVNLYTVKVKEGVDTFTINFDDERIVYAYGDDTKSGDKWLGSCGNADDGAYADGGQVGEMSAVVRKNGDKLPPYLFVQTPYIVKDGNWNSTDLYVIKVETEKNQVEEPSVKPEAKPSTPAAKPATATTTTTKAAAPAKASATVVKAKTVKTGDKARSKTADTAEKAAATDSANAEKSSTQGEVTSHTMMYVGIGLVLFLLALLVLRKLIKESSK